MTEGTTSLPQAVAQFDALGDRAWFNTAHQGPLPRCAVEATERAAALKAAPFRIGDDDFTTVPERLRNLLGRLVGSDPEQIVLGNSTSHGLHLIANGLDWKAGDEVLVVAGDYPATILPWERLNGNGVQVRQLHPDGELLTADELAAAIGGQTRLVAVTWVDSFTGRALDLAAVGEACRAAGVVLVVNASQALGARPLELCVTPVDAVVACGYKWLCGPYGTGFTWLSEPLLDQLQPQQAYWLAMQAGRGLSQMRETKLRDDLGVRAFDTFCPAAFANTLPWVASLELLLSVGIDQIAACDQRLVDRLIAGLDPDQVELISPADGPARSTLVVMSVRSGDTEAIHQQLTDAGVDTAFREGNLRFSVHLFNTDDQVDRGLQILARSSSRMRKLTGKRPR